MLVAQNSNFNKKPASVDRVDHSTPLLLKPTGVPVFKPVDTIKTTNNQHVDQVSEHRVEGTQVDFDFQRTVRAQSIVIGKKVQNSTGINLLDTDNAAAVQESALKREEHHSENKENTTSNQQQHDNNKTLKNNFLKVNAVSDQTKLKEQKHRPKSATTQQLNMTQVQRTKLGANSDIKPQISYVSKLAKQQRPQSAKPQLQIKKKVYEVVMSPPKKETEIPFAQNRYQGQFNNMTKDLFKKAQEALMSEQHQQQKLTEDKKNNKLKIKQLAEEHKKMNQDLVLKQKEKGVERVDFRKKEEEKKEKMKSQENNQERAKVRQTREKRKQESRKQLGLEMFSENKVQEYRNKVKSDFQEKDQANALIKIQRPQSQDVFGSKKQVVNIRTHSALNRDMKDIIQEGRKIEQEEEKQERDKKEILKEMKLKRKMQEVEKKKREEEEANKKLENMKLLEEKLRLQKEEYFKRKELQAKIKEEQKRLQQLQEQEEQQQQQKKKKRKSQKPQHKEQLDDLRNWIEEQMLKEDLKAGQESILEEEEDVYQNQSFNQPQITVKIDKKLESPLKQQMQEETQINQMKLLKHMLPGNHLLSEKEDSKLKGRANRYGVAGDNGYGQVVEIQRQKMQEPKKVSKAHSDKKQLSKEETKKVKEHLVSKVKELSSKVNLEVVETKEDYQVNESQYSEDVYDMEPVKEQEVPSRTVIIAKAHKSPSKSEKKLNADLPGVLNIEKELKRQQFEKLERDTKATLVIQKWTRGFFVRHQLRQAREDKRKEIEEEYSYFEDQIKFNADYNLQKFLKDKQTLREKNKTVELDSGSIQERIGESSSGHFQKPAPQNQEIALFQNFFKTPSDKDPLSLISIFAKRNAPQIVVDEAIPDETEKRRSRKHIETDSDIEESIQYSENFEHPSKKSDSEIEEEIVVSKGSSDQSVPQKKQSFPYKAQSSIAESIQEDYLLSVDRRSRKSPDRDSSIAEESHLQSASRGSLKKKHSRSSIIEEDMDYSEEEKQKKSKSQKKLEHEKQVSEFQVKLKKDEAKRKTYVTEFLTELNRYEQAHISSTMVERVEKIIAQSLAQKDKLILAQRLYELEAEKKHKDEINKIREEQIKLMSQLMLVGGGSNQGLSEEERKQVMENIQKIIDKPIIIEQAHESSSESSKMYEEKDSMDYIEESRTLQTLQVSKKRQTDEDSIQESIMEEDLPEDGSSRYKSEGDEEIKESVYVDGQKQMENGLSMARITLGSEEAVRQQAKKTLEGEQKQKNGTFEKSSFQDFTQQQFKKMMFFDPNSMGEYMQQIEQTIVDKSEKEHKKLKQDYHKQLISPRTYKIKQQELEKWVTNEKKELKHKQQKMLQSAEEVGQYLTKLGEDKRIMLEKIGSPRGKRVLDLTSSQGSIDYEDIEEESNDSIRVRAARNQLRHVQKNLKYDQVDEKLTKKKATAKKLLQEKEKAIQEGIKQKMRNIEAEYVDELLNEALNLDIDQEIEKRIRGAKQQQYEESNTWTEGSQYQGQHDSISQSARSVPDGKKKKKVVFASPPSESKDRFSSVYSYQESAESKTKLSSHKFEESIGESIKIEDSYQISQPSVQQDSKTTQHKEHSIRDSIKESNIEESVASSHYSEDFISQSQQSDNTQNNQLLQSRNKLQAKAETIEEHNDIGYSMNFDEDSMGQSQQFGTQQSKNQHSTEKIQERVDEEAQEESMQQDKVRESFNNIKEIQDDSSDVEDEGEQQLLESKTSYQQEPQSESDADKEVLYSAKSIEWQINLEQQLLLESQRLKQKSEGSIEEQYSENFDEEPVESEVDKEQEAIDDLNDLDSFPDEIEESFNDFQQKADNITDELLQLVLQEFKNDGGFKTKPQVDESEFKDKFPYTLDVPAPEPDEEDEIPFKSLQQLPQIEVKVKTSQQASEDLLKKKFEEQQQLIKESQEKVSTYVSFLISQVNRRELIASLEKPIEVDPLKILARIQAFENDESQSFTNLNETSHSQAVLPFEFFIDTEKEFKVKNGEIDLTESQNIRSEMNDHKAIFDAFNDALDQERPYKQKGLPAPWSKQTRVINPKITVAMVEKMLTKAQDKVLQWAKTGAGTKYAPLPPPPPPSQNEFEQSQQQQNQQPEEERRNALREERLGELLTKEIEENDALWVDYEIEDAQVKFDLADMVLEQLASEVAEIILQKQGTTR